MIRVLPSLPEFRYVYSCPRCGSHRGSMLKVDSGDSIERVKICGVCAHVYQDPKSGNCSSGDRKDAAERLEIRRAIDEA